MKSSGYNCLKTVQRRFCSKKCTKKKNKIIRIYYSGTEWRPTKTFPTERSRTTTRPIRSRKRDHGSTRAPSIWRATGPRVKNEYAWNTNRISIKMYTRVEHVWAAFCRCRRALCSSRVRNRIFSRCYPRPRGYFSPPNRREEPWRKTSRLFYNITLLFCSQTV